MKRAAPAIALSAAGLTWLLHAQGVIDTKPAQQASPTDPSTTAPAPDAPAATSPPTSSAPSPETPPTTTTPSSRNGTVNGPVIDTRYGPVQVEVVLSGSQISDVRALEYPNEARRSQDINAQALPMLHDEVLAAQSPNIDTISGATYTTFGYEQSLQAALEQAGILRQ